ncbi:MAG: hypothetical protein R3D60_02100 [Paracoccaceae bacterium]
MTLSSTQNYLKHHTESLVKDVGIEAAAEISGKSKASLNRYYSTHPEHADRFMPLDVIAALEGVASFPHVTTALADLRGVTLAHDEQRPNSARRGSVNSDVIALSQRFAMLIAEYQTAIEDGTISANEARRLLQETVALQRVLIDMKLNLEREAT